MRFALLTLMALMSSGCTLFQPTLKAAKVSTVLRPNRLIEEGSLWRDAEMLVVTLRNAQLPRDTLQVGLRAVHDGQAVGFLVQWRDRTPITDYERSWVRLPDSPTYFLRELPPDTLSLKFSLSGERSACMMSGEEGDYDLWRWRAGWSNIAGYADDARMLIRRSPPESGDFSTYAGVVAGPPIYIQVIPDAGRPPYTLADRPRERSYHTLPGLNPQPPTESQGDILAEGLHQAGSYFVEFHRPLETGHDDDFQFVGGGPFEFAIAITNDAAGQAHYTSDLIRLRLE